MVAFWRIACVLISFSPVVVAQGHVCAAALVGCVPGWPSRSVLEGGTCHKTRS